MAGFFLHISRIDLVVIRGTITYQRYVDEVIHPQVLSISQSVVKSLPARQCQTPYLQYYNELFASRSCQQSRLTVQSGLSSVKHLWDILGQQVGDLYPFPAVTLPKLERLLVEQWQRIP